jgi:hypothetical protein
MITVDVCAEAARYGLTLRVEQHDIQGTVWHWHHGADPTGPAFLTERDAVGWMESRLRATFERW